MDCSCSLIISENIHIAFFEDATFGWLYCLLFLFLPLPFFYYSQPPVYIALL